MKISQVVIAVGTGFTDIPVQSASHRMRIFDASSSRLQLDYKLKDDDFTAIQSTVSAEANVITIKGNAQKGLLGRPANYNAVDEPATGEIVAKVRTTGAAGCTVTVMEDNEPF